MTTQESIETLERLKLRVEQSLLLLRSGSVGDDDGTVIKSHQMILGEFGVDELYRVGEMPRDKDYVVPVFYKRRT